MQSNETRLTAVFFRHPFANMSAQVESTLRSLTLEEKISLLAGKNFWETVPVPAKGVPAIKVRLAAFNRHTESRLK